MKFKIEAKENVHVISLEGNLLGDYDNNGFLEEINRLIDEHHASLFILNLSKLENLNSSGLGVLITILTRSRKLGGDTVITGIPEKINKLLIITKLNTVFHFADSVELAKKMLLKTV